MTSAGIVLAAGASRRMAYRPKQLIAVGERTLLGVVVEAANGEMHPVQRAFHTEHGLQCGFCTPGMMMTAKALLASNPNPTEVEIRHGLEGNVCRCTGYQHIVNAVKAAAAGAGK